MPKKEDRSDWVAVAPDANVVAGIAETHAIKPATTAFQYYQRDAGDATKAEIIAASDDGKFEVGKFSKRLREKWTALDDQEKAKYETLAQQDLVRFRSESHQADVEAIQRRERMQRDRDTLYEGGSTRRQRAKLERKEQKRQQKKKKKKERQPSEAAKQQQQQPSDASSSSEDDDDDSDDDSDASKNKKRKGATAAPRPLSAKQLERKQKLQDEKQQKESIIAQRQEDILKDKAAQAKKRLDFLLKQSNIFSHFGQVKEDRSKFGIGTSSSAIKKGRQVKGEDEAEDDDDDDDAALVRRAAIGGAAGGGGRSSSSGSNDMEEDEELEEADEHQATFLTAQPTTIGHGKMRDYQLEGLNWMIRLQENGVNGILADEMGLGKTLQSISVLVYMQEYQNSNGPHLIIVPKSTLSNWMNELARWAPTLKAIKFHGDKASREEMANTVLCPGKRDDERSWSVCVTTYEVCNIEKNVLMKFAWSYLIIDEAHRLKNEASEFSRTVRMFETRYRILITGTPLQNSLHELWALLNFLVPDVFADAEQFDEWFNLDIDDDDEKNRLISQLHKILRPFMLRRLKKEVEKSLPPKHETILFTGMSKMQKKLYRDILIRDIDSIRGTSGGRTAILNIVMQLRKCAGHPYLFPGVEDRTLPPLGEHLVENCGKMVLLDKLLKRLKERGHRVLLFTQMTRILDILEDYLVMRRFSYCRIDGSTSYELREDQIDAYNAPNSEKFLFLLSTRAGGLGINLQTADVVILYDSDWNPQADLQAQDRAHRIGQKREVQVFRFVTEHTIEEKIVERAQQKLKLDAMVVQQGRLKEKDKLSRDELLEAVRFGADKIFKSKDSSITDEDIDLILDAGKRKTQELNDKLQAADKGDLLDFKLDGGGNMQTFEGIDYSSNALAAAKAEAELLGILDVGKRERRTVSNYNESKLYAEQVAAIQGKPKERKKKKTIRLPKAMRLPRMEEWQMYNRTDLLAIQEREEKTFRELPEDVQKLALQKPADTVEMEDAAGATGEEEEVDKMDVDTEESAAELPPLLDEETKKTKELLLAEGFSSWSRIHYSAFIKACAKFGREEYGKIALEVGKSEEDVKSYAVAFWGDLGKERISQHEYDRVTNLIAKGEKKIEETNQLARAVRILVSIFDNPWEELEFSHVNTKDKLFSADNDRYLLCWTHKFGVGQWHAIKMAIRRSPKFRFDYFLRSAPVEMIGKRCEHLMRAALKEVEFLENKAREAEGASPDAGNGDDLPPIELPRFREMKKLMADKKEEEKESQRRVLAEKVESLEKQMQEIQDRLTQLSKDPQGRGTTVVTEDKESSAAPASTKEVTKAEQETPLQDEMKGAVGPGGEFVDFPDYDGTVAPKDAKKAFAIFCSHFRKEVKASLDDSERKDKDTVNEKLKERYMSLSDSEKTTWREWASWDKKRYARDAAIFASVSGKPMEKDGDRHVPKKKRRSRSKTSDDGDVTANVPKKKKKKA